MPVQPDFVPWMQSQVLQWADRYGCDARRAFPAWALNFILDVNEDDSYTQTATLSQGDAGLDGWEYDKENGIFHLVQAKYLDDPATGTVSPGQVDPLLRAALLLQSPAHIEDGPHRDKLTTIALELEQGLLDDASIVLDLYIAGRFGDQAKADLQQAVSALGPPYSAEVYDVPRLYELHLSDDPIADLSGQVVHFAVSGEQEFYERSNLGIPGVDKAAVAVFDGRSVADAVDEWRARLFHGNVRYYLRRSNRVNKSMLRTLESEDGEKAFWLYNNGLTIVADKFEFQSEGGEVRLAAWNPQIVNGAQTSSVLRDRRAHLDPGDVSVQARVIAVADTEQGQEALKKISEYTNHQSPVGPADLRSNDRRHRELQAGFKSLSPAIFYERRRGEWQSLDAATKALYGNRKVTKEEVGQRYLAFIGRPAEAVSKKEALYGLYESEAFDPAVSAKIYMLAYTLYEQADNLMKTTNAASLIALVPGFTQPLGVEDDATTQLEALRRAHKLVCSHATALAHDILTWRYNEIGPEAALLLRERFQDQQGSTYPFCWRFAFRTIRNWLANRADKTAVKSTLQRTDTVVEMRAMLQDNLVEANRDDLPAI